MKAITVLAALVSVPFVSGQPAAGQPAPERAAGSPYAAVRIDVGMVVSDLERSLKFYRDDLGLSPAAPPSFDVPADIARDAGITEGKPLHVAVLVLGEGDGAAHLKLLEFPEAKKVEGGVVAASLGVRYLTFQVKDMAAVMERMKARSVPVVAKGPLALPGGISIAFVRDPDGNLIEFVGKAGGAAAAPSEGGSLFDGKSLAGWHPLKSGTWKVVDGAILGEQGADKGGGWLVSDRSFGDFDLRFKFRLSKGANSGVAIRFPGDDENPAKSGYEIQLSEADPNYQTGSVFGLLKAPQGLYREGEWSEGRILAKGPKIATWIDGKQAAAVEDKRSLRGHLALQVHGGPKYQGMRVEIKDIEVRE